jgi:hypothetical protein
MPQTSRDAHLCEEMRGGARAAKRFVENLERNEAVVPAVASEADQPSASMCDDTLDVVPVAQGAAKLGERSVVLGEIGKASRRGAIQSEAIILRIALVQHSGKLVVQRSIIDADGIDERSTHRPFEREGRVEQWLEHTPALRGDRGLAEV